MTLYRLLTAIFLVLVGASAADAQERFRSAKEFHEEIARLDALKAQFEQRHVESEKRSADFAATVAKLREELLGVKSLDEQDQRRIDQLTTDLEAHQRSRQQIQRELDSTLLRRAALLVKHRADLDPAFLQEVELSFFDPRDRANQSLYRARWRADERTRSREEEVLSLLQHLGEMEVETPDLERHVAEAERQFRATSARWQMRSADFEMQVGRIAPFTNVVAEAADVAVSVLQGGTAAILFEGVYRPIEALVKGAPASRLPPLSTEILAARAQLEKAELQDVASVVDHQRTLPTGADEPDAVAIRRLMDSIRRDSTLLGLAASALPASLEAEGAPEALKQIAELGTGAFAEALADMRKDPTAFRQLSREAIERSIFGVFDNAEKTIVGPKYFKDWFKGAGAGAAVAAAKAGVKALSEAEAQRIFNDMAGLELEWFLRRRAYVSANRVLQQHRGNVAIVIARLNAIYKQRDADEQGRRELEVSQGDPIVLGDWHWKQNPSVTLAFTGSIPSARVRLGREYRSSGMARHSLRPSNPGVGVHALEVEADTVGTQFHDLHDGFDGDPATYARLRPGLTWEGRESGPDKSHRVTFASPSLAILKPAAAEAFVAGSTIEVAFVAPTTAREDAWIGVVRPDVPHEIPKGGPTILAATKGSFALLREAMSGGRGKVSFKAPTSPGRYELRLYDREAEGISMAVLPFCVREPGIAGLYDEECSTLIGDWIMRGRPGFPDTKMTIVYAVQPDRFASIAEIAGMRPEAVQGKTVYDVFETPRQAGDLPRLRCVRDGKQLYCRVRVMPSASRNCPTPPPGWAEGSLTIEFGDRIEGYARVTAIFGNTKCAFEPLPPGINVPWPFRIEMVRETPAESRN